MKIRLEFGRSHSHSFDWVLRLCKMESGYSFKNEAGVDIHSVDFDGDSLSTFCALFSKIANWKNLNIYIDDKFTEKYRAYRLARQGAAKHQHISTTLDQLNTDLKRKAAESGLKINIRWTGRERKP